MMLRMWCGVEDRDTVVLGWPRSTHCNTQQHGVGVKGVGVGDGGGVLLQAIGNMSVCHAGNHKLYVL